MVSSVLLLLGVEIGGVIKVLSRQLEKEFVSFRICTLASRNRRNVLFSVRAL